tara:strand:- start:2853 stop:3695 length:843 start_codon:yes stop_codon:yes gene_type:complete
VKLDSQIPAPILPNPEQSSVLELGLTPCSKPNWLAIDEDFAHFHAHKLQQFETHPDKVFAALPQSVAAQEEFSQVLLEDLLTNHADLYYREGNLLHQQSGIEWHLDTPDLAASSLWIPEDICLLQQLGDEHILTAASICSPSNWQLKHKIGRNLNVIHDPVPRYKAILQERVNRMLSQMNDQKLILRFNWSIQRGNELCWHPELYPPDFNDALYWRIERQTLRRLPLTRAIVFGIRIYLESFAQLERRIPAFRQQVRKLIDNLDAEQRSYKGLDSILTLL